MRATVKRPAHDGVATVTAAAGVPATEATIVRANPEHPQATRWRTVAVPAAPIVTRRSVWPLSVSVSVTCVPVAPATVAPIQPVSSVVVVSVSGGVCARAGPAAASAASAASAVARSRRARIAAA